MALVLKVRLLCALRLKVSATLSGVRIPMSLSSLVRLLMALSHIAPAVMAITKSRHTSLWFMLASRGISNAY